MKKRTFLISIFISIALFISAQVPQKFNYQAVVRNAQHALMSNQDVGFKMSILRGVGQYQTTVYVETHTVTTNPAGVADLVIGDGSVVSGTFKDISWGDQAFYLKVEADPAGGTSYEHLGTTQLISVPYSLYSANISSPTKKFTIQENADHPVDSALFEVRNAEGQTVFAVYPEGTRVYVLDEEGKGRKGGFAVGGYSRASKGITQEYLRVTPDSIRMYFDETPVKGRKGGFAVGGYSRASKGPTDQYFTLKPDSAKFTLISDQPVDSHSGALSVTTKSTIGDETDQGGNLFNLTRSNYFIGHRAGEAITSGTQNSFFGYESGTNTTTGNSNIFIGERSGQQNINGSTNSFIGLSAGQSNIDGFHNVYLGYYAGKENVSGKANVMIGPEAGLHSLDGWNVFVGADAGKNHVNGYSNVFLGQAAGLNADTSYANVFIGQFSGYNNSGGGGNVFVGNATGQENKKGFGNTFIGAGAGNRNINGENNTFLGSGSGTNNLDAIGNVFVGYGSGRDNVSGNLNVFIGSNSGWYHTAGNGNVFIGEGSGFENITGESNVFVGAGAGVHNNGKDNIFIGFNAGRSAIGDGKLYVDINNNDSHNALIYGEFYNSRVQINRQLGIGMAATDHALEVAGEVSKTTPGEWLANSDARIKKEVRDIENACDQISRLRPVTYRYSEEWMQMNPSVKDKTYYNFIAQEYREVFPQSVQKGGESLEGDEQPLLQLDGHPANVVAIKAIQELAEQNRAQQAIIEKLVEKVSSMEKVLEGL